MAPDSMADPISLILEEPGSAARIFLVRIAPYVRAAIAVNGAVVRAIIWRFMDCLNKKLSLNERVEFKIIAK